MSLEDIKSEIASMPLEEQNQLAAFLVYLRHARDPEHASETASKIDDSDPSSWMSIDELREHWKD